MENQSEANRKRKNTEEELTAGFKKALVSASTTYDHGLNEFGAQELAAGGAPQADTRPQGHATRLPADAQRDQPSRTPTSSEVQAADAVLSTMVGILAGTGDARHELRHAQQTEPHATQQNHLNQDNHSSSHHNATGAVNDDVLHMQQQLQQQIPLDSSTQGRLTHHQLMDSMSSIPNMHLLLEESLKRDLAQKRDGADGQRRQEDTARSAQSSTTEDARAVLMNLNDPSILVTLTPHTAHTPQPSHPSSPLPNTSHVDLPPPANQGKGKKKAKAPRATTGSVAGVNKDGADASGFDLQERLKSDTAAVTSDNPLHTKWLMATALKDKGISYKTGTFSSHEDELIRETIKGYVARNNMPEDAIQRWFENGNGRGRFEKNDLKALWVEIAVRLQNRPLLNIYLHVRRMFHPQNNIGTWSKEDDQKLIMLHALHKGQWTTIGTELGRMADSCRDRYRNHLKDQSTMLTGPWQPHEDEQLLTIMQDLALQQGKINILDSSPMWTLISERMHGTRTRHQCRHRYSQTLQPRLERGEWTAPSSAAAAAAAAVAANAAVAASVSSSSSSKQVSQQQHLQAHNSQLGLSLSPNPGLSPNHGVSSGHEQGKTTAEQDVLMLAAALQGVLPDHDNGHMLWSQAVSNDMHGQDAHHSISPGSHDPFTAAAIAAAASLPLPTIVPKAPKGPIRRRSGLQQQLDTLRIIQEDGYTDHTDIDWSNIAQRLRDRVEEANAIQLAKIIQTHDQLDSKKQRHLQDGDSAAAAAAAASAAMAAAVSAAQAEAVASLQRVPAANQCARTFMSSRCKIEGYRDMTLQQVIVFMMKDVERRIMHRRGGPGSSSKRGESSSGGGDGSEGSSSKSSSSGALSKEASKEAVIQQQEIIINNAAQQAAIAALSAQFPFLQQHHQQQHGQSALAHALSDPSDPHFSAHSSSSASAIPQTSSAPPSSSGQSTIAEENLSVEQRAQRQQELEQQQHNHDLAEQMLNFAFSITDMSHNPFQHQHFSHHQHHEHPHQHQQHHQGSMLISSSMSSTSSISSVSSSSWPVDEASSTTASQREKQATRRVLHALKSSDFATDTSEDDDDAEDGGQGNP
ncbi:RNA polymerase I enhancer binding protein [Linnemannia exigua]|uniref:RNA polymerase I enhancer binding protein n=1 Tax=Linnemannia exigua TaxID=604196 RepID=A0AAD4H680_9FUNG|nr:RNA polymerase I enhancer binding protein [Linnemannia exigua]